MQDFLITSGITESPLDSSPTVPLNLEQGLTGSMLWRQFWLYVSLPLLRGQLLSPK